MPGGDRTGPMGQGSVTGRKLGYCTGFDSPGFTKGAGGGMGRGFAFGRGMGAGRGMGRGRSFGRGWGSGPTYPGYFPGYPLSSTMSREDEIRFLNSEADALKRSQEEIEKRLKELEK
jgi:hypothetical protein